MLKFFPIYSTCVVIIMYLYFMHKVLVLKSTAIKILEIMCEETNLQSQDLVGNIFKEVDINALHDSLAYFYSLSQDKSMVR